MIFNSIEFAIFLPIVFILYWFVFNRNLKLQNLFVVLASYVFYGWWDYKFLILIAFTSLCSWISGILIKKYRDKGKDMLSKWISISNIVVNLTILGVFKYYNFFVQSFADVFLNGNSETLLLNVILPVGVSFYTFQALSYSIDVYRNKIEPTKDVVEFFAFVSFFPQLVAGPIERATNLLPQFSKKREFDYAQAVDGCRQILWGLFKKIAVADRCAVIVEDVFSTYQSQPGSTLLLGAIMFTFQIYGDFSGYSDIAIGTSKLFGIKLMRNFNVPYFSRDIAEFWRRWHISLTTWFRDYIYIPLGGSRCSKIKAIRNTFIIFLVSGLWHGANWTFLIWGAYHAFLFIPLLVFNKNRKYKEVVACDRKFPTFGELVRIAVTFFLVVIGWVIFRAESASQAWEYICGIFQVETVQIAYKFLSIPSAKLTTVTIIIMMIFEWINRSNMHGLCLDKVKSQLVRYVIYISIIFILMVFYVGEPSQFIYFQF